MKLPTWITVAFSLAATVGARAQTAAVEDPQVLRGKAAVIELGRYAFVTISQEEYLAGAIDSAVAGGAAAIVLRIDCPGGFAAGARRFVERLRASELPVVSLVEGGAAGSAAFAALAADHVFIKPGAGPIGGEVEEIEWRGPKEDLPARLVDLAYWDVSEEMQGLLKGAGVQEEVVAGLGDISLEVNIDGKKYSDAGDVLRIDVNIGGALGIVDGAAGDVVEALEAANIAAEPHPIPAPEVIIRRDGRIADASGEGGALETGDETGPTPGPEGGTAEAGAAEEDEERSFGETRLESYQGKIVVIEVGQETLMRSTKFEFMQRIIAKADEDGAAAIIFDMDTPGGALWDTKSQMLKYLQNIDVPTYTYINPRALSAGSMIAVSTDHIYMHPPSTIGASAPVTGMGGDIEGKMYKKIISAFLAAAEDVARIKGYDYELVKAFIEVEASFEARVPVVSSSGSLGERVVVSVGPEELLTLGSAEAAQVIDGRPLLAEGLAKTLDEVISQAGLQGEVVRAEPLGFEAVADWLVKLAPWLLLFGIAGAYIELKAPGFGVPGAISLVCFGLFFFGHKTAGYLAGFEAIGVFLLGIIFVILEIFVFPGLMIFGALGVVMILGSIIYAMVDPVDLGWDGKLDFSNVGEALSGPAVNLLLALIGAGLLIMLALRYLPSTPLMRWLILDSGLNKGTGMKLAGEAGALEAGIREGDAEPTGLLGQTGTAETDLRPSGAVRIGGERVDVISAGEFIVRGARVRVVEQNGARIVVESVEGD